MSPDYVGCAVSSILLMSALNLQYLATRAIVKLESLLVFLPAILLIMIICSTGADDDTIIITTFSALAVMCVVLIQEINDYWTGY